MPHIDKHEPGSFSWIELATTDQNAAKTFYGNLFGWSADDQPMGPGNFYTMFLSDSRPAAAAYTLRPEQRSQGVPPFWMIYIDVRSADETVQNAQDAGGTVLAPPFDVYDFGRMAVLRDPTGAVFSVWQAKGHSGAGITGVDGTLCWADLNTPDADRAKQFYSAVFGWQIEPGEHDPSGYLHIKNGSDFIGGIPPAAHRNPQAPPHWLAYILVSDCDASAAKAKGLGANLLMPPTSMENVGRWAVVADPQGAVFAIFQPARRG